MVCFWYKENIVSNIVKQKVSLQKIFPEQSPNQVLTHHIMVFYDPFSR